MRKPAVAGMFYPSSSQALIKQIEECFEASKGPGALPTRPKKAPPVQAVIVPHAGYVYSGMAAAWGYKEIAERDLPDVFVIFGPNHHLPLSSVSLDTWETPLGLARPHQELGRALISSGLVSNDEPAHAKEHSIEVQLPLLQYVLGERFSQTRILPVMVSHDVDLDLFANAIKKALGKLKATFIISSDFTHQGHGYGYVPFERDVKDNIYKMDKHMIDKVLNGDYEGFDTTIEETGATVCGAIPISLALRLAQGKGVLEQYYTSGDINGDYSSSVSYACVVFK